MYLAKDQLELILEWFGTAEDLASSQYLRQDDYNLAYAIFVEVGRRIPKSILLGKERQKL